MVLQMHYHPQGDDSTDDNTRVNLRFLDDAPERIAEIRVMGAVTNAPHLEAGPNDDGDPEFRIPKDAVNHTETMRVPLPVPEDLDVRIWGLLPHMHYVGTDILAVLERPEPATPELSEQCLVHVPRWDFNYQYFYLLDAALEETPKLFPGDILMIRCTYTNNMSKNTKLAGAIAQDPLVNETQDVVVGEETLDEMCAVLIGVSYPNPNKP